MFDSVFIDLLWLSATACLIAFLIYHPDNQNLYISIAIYLIAAVTGYLNFVSERNQKKIQISLNLLQTYQYSVIRQGLEVVVNEEEITVGDIILIGPNQRIPCDVRIIECSPDLQVDSSIFTGNLEPQHKQTEPQQVDNPLQAVNILFTGTTCIQGMAKGLVVNIGDQTIFGQILHIVKHEVRTQSPLSQNIRSIVMSIEIKTTIIAVIIILRGYYVQELNGVQLMILFIGLIVASLPTGMMSSI